MLLYTKSRNNCDDALQPIKTGAGGTHVLVAAHYNVVSVLLIFYVQIMHMLPATEKKPNAALIKTAFLAFLGPLNERLYLICCDIHLDYFPFPCCTASHPCQKAPPKSLMSRISRPQRRGMAPTCPPNQGNSQKEQKKRAPFGKAATGSAPLDLWKKQGNWSSGTENGTFPPEF